MEVVENKKLDIKVYKEDIISGTKDFRITINKMLEAKPDLLLLLAPLPELDIVAKQVEAIKNIKFDKITVWDGGAGSKEGSTTANFMRDLIKALPAMHDLAGQAGIQLPQILGKVETPEAEVKKETKSAE